MVLKSAETRRINEYPLQHVKPSALYNRMGLGGDPWLKHSNFWTCSHLHICEMFEGDIPVLLFWVPQKNPGGAENSLRVSLFCPIQLQFPWESKYFSVDTPRASKSSHGAEHLPNKKCLAYQRREVAPETTPLDVTGASRAVSPFMLGEAPGRSPHATLFWSFEPWQHKGA